LFQEHLQFLAHRNLNQISSPRAQQLRERIDNFVFLPKPNYRILMHGGVTPFMDAELDFDNRIPAGHAASFNSCAYTSFDHSSRRRCGRWNGLDHLLTIVSIFTQRREQGQA
jgi:hypothetical protein